MSFISWELQNDENGHSYGQLVTGSFITTMCLLTHHLSGRIFWPNIKSPRWLSPPATQTWCPAILAFPKMKITFEREEISDHQWDSGKYDEAANGDSTKDFAECFEQWKRCWEKWVKSQGAYFEGDWGIIVLCTLFLVSCINVSIFDITWLDTFWTDFCIILAQIQMT